MTLDRKLPTPSVDRTMNFFSTPARLPALGHEAWRGNRTRNRHAPRTPRLAGYLFRSSPLPSLSQLRISLAGTAFGLEAGR